jgi:Hpt domain
MPECAPVNLDRFLDSVDGDVDLRSQLIELFEVECNRLRRELRASIEGADAEAAGRTAHRLKGCIAVFVSDGPFISAGEIETSARNGDLAMARAHLHRLERELDVLLRALTPFSARRQA